MEPPSSSENETLRWPTNLDRAAIIARLVQVRAAARAAGLEELAARFAEVETMPSPQVGAGVVAALTLVQGRPEHRAIATQLEMIAMNLRNLR